jgi:hypothetical protein
MCGRWLTTSRVEVVRAGDARTVDPDTSKLAALRQQPRSDSQRGRILAYLRTAGPCTAREIEAGTAINGAWKRVSELKAGGHIHPAGTRFDEETRTDVTVFAAGAPQPAEPALF